MQLGRSAVCTYTCDVILSGGIQDEKQSDESADYDFITNVHMNSHAAEEQGSDLPDCFSDTRQNSVCVREDRNMYSQAPPVCTLRTFWTIWGVETQTSCVQCCELFVIKYFHEGKELMFFSWRSCRPILQILDLFGVPPIGD